MSKRIQIISYVLFSGVLLLGFNNCAKARFSSTSNNNGVDGSPTPVTPPTVAETCLNQTNIAFTAPVFFPANTGHQCNWSATAGTWNSLGNGFPAGGNAGDSVNKMGNTYYTARAEEPADPIGSPNITSLPAGAVLCDVSLTSSESSFEYDDQIILNFDGYVIASTVDFINEVTPDGVPYFLQTDNVGNSGSWIYDWTKLKGKNWVPGYYPWSPFCAGATGDDCKMPQQYPAVGQIAINPPADVIQTIMEQYQGNGHYLQLITTGDNDSTDCQHTDMHINISGHYVIKTFQ